MDFIISAFNSTIHILYDSSPYIILGLLASGLLRVFISPSVIANHLGTGKFMPVFKAAFFGIPIPLCSCGVLPAAISLKKQGANNGAVTSFLISTPESGADSIAITYALLDPIMTVARPLSAFVTALFAGIAENIFENKEETEFKPDFTCPIDGCCTGIDCPDEVHKHHHSFGEKIIAGFKFSVTDVWEDIAAWFFVGIIAAGVITALVPDDFFEKVLGGGIVSLLIMLAAGIPIYICATASTPIAAALILKGVSPGAALVFLLAGPATNVTSLSVIFGTIGRRAAFIYLASIAAFSLLAGLTLDYVYETMGISAKATAGTAAELFPEQVMLLATVIIILISIGPLFRAIKAKIKKPSAPLCANAHCGCEETGNNDNHDFDYDNNQNEDKSCNADEALNTETSCGCKHK